MDLPHILLSFRISIHYYLDWSLWYPLPNLQAFRIVFIGIAFICRHALKGEHLLQLDVFLQSELINLPLNGTTIPLDMNIPLRTYILAFWAANSSNSPGLSVKVGHLFHIYVVNLLNLHLKIRLFQIMYNFIFSKSWLLWSVSPVTSLFSYKLFIRMWKVIGHEYRSDAPPHDQY